jgi:hypothetical protein
VPKLKSMTIAHRVVPAGKRRRCHHDKKHMILKGQTCLEVREGMGWKGYCVACGIAMASEGVRNLNDLRGVLVPHNGNPSIDKSS